MKGTHPPYATGGRMPPPQNKETTRKEVTMDRRTEGDHTSTYRGPGSLWTAAKDLCTSATTRAGITLAIRLPAAAANTADRLEAAAHSHRRTMLMASAMAMLAGFVLLSADTAALAGQGGGSSNISFDEGADQIFSLIGTVALIVGVVVGIGSLAMKRVMAALGFGLGGALIWACCQRPEQTLGAAANWIIEQFTTGTGGGGG